MFDLRPANEVLGAMITPALLISAAGTLVLSTSNRLGRVVDLVRTLGQMAAELVPPVGTPVEDVADTRQLIVDQLEKLGERVRYLMPAIATLYSAIGMLVASSISVGMVGVLGWKTAWLPVVLGLSGATALFYASTLLVREARVAAASTLSEMTYVRKRVARRSVAWDMKSPL